MDEAKHRTFDITLKTVAALTAFGTFFWGVTKFSKERRDRDDAARVSEERTRERDFSNELFKRDLSQYEAIATASGGLILAGDSAKYESSKIDFERLYWSNTLSIRAPEFDRAMDKLRDAIRFSDRGLISLGDATPQDQVKIAAHRLTDAIRAEIEGRLKRITAK